LPLPLSTISSTMYIFDLTKSIHGYTFMDVKLEVYKIPERVKRGRDT
jgi:hypothetical protein